MNLFKHIWNIMKLQMSIQKLIFILIKTTLNYPRNMQKLNSSLDYLEKGLKIYKYDEEKFKFNKMLDEYKVKLNNFDKLGKISFSFKNNKLIKKCIRSKRLL